MSAHALKDLVEEHGYAIVRGVFDAAEVAEIQRETAAIYAEGMTHPSSWRHGNKMFEVSHDPAAGHVVLQAHWFALTNPVMEAYRRHPKLLPLLEPFVGRTIRQSTNQIHWKPPGAQYSSFNYHQDARFTGLDPNDVAWLMPYQITTGLAIDPQTKENGCLRIFPGSHRLGYLGLSDGGKGFLMTGDDQTAEMIAAGLDPAGAVDVEMEPGDLVLWTLLTVHGSGRNSGADNARAFQISAYVNGAKIQTGEVAFEDGRSVALDPTQLTLRNYTNPEPHYTEAPDWLPDDPAT